MSDETGVPKGNQMRLPTYTDADLMVMRLEAKVRLRDEQDNSRRNALLDGITLLEVVLTERGYKFGWTA